MRRWIRTGVAACLWVAVAPLCCAAQAVRPNLPARDAKAGGPLTLLSPPVLSLPVNSLSVLVGGRNPRPMAPAAGTTGAPAGTAPSGYIVPNVMAPPQPQTAVTERMA